MPIQLNSPFVRTLAALGAAARASRQGVTQRKRRIQTVIRGIIWAQARTADLIRVNAVRTGLPQMAGSFRGAPACVVLPSS